MPLGCLVAGGQDTLINVFPVGSTHSEPTHTLLGHSENVCALDATPRGTIISGSWDKYVIAWESRDMLSETANRRTARVWKNFNSVYELKGHTQAVWAVVAIDDEQFLTGISGYAMLCSTIDALYRLSRQNDSTLGTT